MSLALAAVIALLLPLIGLCLSETTLAPKKVLNATKPTILHAAAIIASPEPSLKPLTSTISPFSTSHENKNVSETKATTTSESPTTRLYSTTKVHTTTKGVAKSARKQKLNSGSSVAGVAVHSARLQERLGAVECELSVLPRESRLWRGNETHELRLPVTMAEDCVTRGGRGAIPSTEECPPAVVSWEGSADIQTGDILIVRIDQTSLLDSFGSTDARNASVDDNSTHFDSERLHRTLPQPAVYQVTRQGHEHCDVSEGSLLDVAPLDDTGDQLLTLYDKDLTEGVNLIIVVSENWKSQCVRLKVTVKSDNCGESQDCSGKGVCYTNVSMDGYECQCCPGYVGPHCEDRDACNPSPCLNNGICVDLTQPLKGINYHCLCPYGFTGRKCEKDPCYSSQSSPCLNGGSCMSQASNGSAGFRCACAAGWGGARCELPAAGGACASGPCQHGICVEHDDNDVDGRHYRCFCQPGYTGEQCEVEYNECESSPCGNGGTCTDRIAGFQCACGRGYTGNTCQLKVDLCSPNPCPPHRYCVDRGNNYGCECPRGYVGEECHLRATSMCDNNPCAHGGTCWTGVDSYYCSCRPGYTGRLCEEDYVLESVIGSENDMEAGTRGGGAVREVRLPLGLYHDRLHNVYIAAGTLGAAIAIVGVVVTACHCRVNKTYARMLSRLSRVRESGPPHHWLQDKRPPPPSPFPPPTATLDTTDMYYTLDFSDSQSSPLIQ